jgi:uncharacterized protein YjiS (DUF1127 family)
MPQTLKTTFRSRAAAPTQATTVLQTLLQWATRQRNRRSLSRLDDHMLRDIGLDRTTVAQECAKPFWQD